MTKDQLIEQLAGELYTKRWGAAAPRPWEDTEEDVREIWREQIRTFYPLIVEFIASWIAATAEHGYLEPSEIAQLFRKEFA